MTVKLDYHFVAGTSEAWPARGLPLRNPLLAMLDAVHAHGSIATAARELGLSYRHLWGELKRHETCSASR